MHRPGHSMGSVITATGVTPDIVLANFFIVYCYQVVIFSLAGLMIKHQLKPSTHGWAIIRAGLYDR
jgi:hypothetical protein